MTRQRSIVEYLEMKSVIASTSGNSEKRLTVTHRKTPTAMNIVRTLLNYSEENVIDLCSDDDDESVRDTPVKFDSENCINKMTLPEITELNALCEITPRKVQKISTQSSPGKSPAMKCVIMNESPVNSQENFQDAPKTPQKNTTSTNISPNKYLSPNNSLMKNKSPVIKNLAESLFQHVPKTPEKKTTPSKTSGKYYSPTKNCLVKKRSPVKKKVIQGLFQDADTAQDLDSSQDEMVDDKAMMLLTNIRNMLKDPLLFNLLDKNCQDILNKCLLVEKPCLKLLCKLYWRQHLWYRFHKLLKMCQSKENNSIDSPVMQLILKSLVENDLLMQSSLGSMDSLPFEDLIKTLNVIEIKQICKDFKIKIKSKQSASTSLMKFCQQKSISAHFNGNCKTNKERVLNQMKDKLGVCYKLSDSAKTALYKFYLIMYLGINYNVIRENKLEWTIIYDKIKKETFPIDKTMELDNATCVFSSREEFESYLNVHLIYESFFIAKTCDDKCKIVEGVYEAYKNILEEDMTRYMSYSEWLRKYTPPHIYIKILESGVDDLKRQKKSDAYLLAVEILTTLIEQKTFRRHKVGRWYAEKALILHNYLRRHDEAAMLLIEGFKSDISEEAKEMMQPRAIRISKQQNTYISEELRESLRICATLNSKMECDLPSKCIIKHPIDNYGKKGKIKFEVRTDDKREFMDVEDYCIYHYTTFEDYTHAYHWESKIVITIYNLLFWDIIYTKPCGVRGVFLTYYQRYPLDMCYESFYNNRSVWIEDRLSEISRYSEDQLMEAMKKTWLERPDCEISGIVRSIGWENVSTVASCLGPERVAIICRRLAMNYGYTRSGFPDVTVWNNITKKITFLEVKSDSDKPSLKQIQWMHYLHSNGIDTAFVYIGKNADCRVKSRPIQILEDCDEGELEI